MVREEDIIRKTEGSCEPSVSSRDEPAPHPVRRLERAFGPVLAGVILDCVDFATIGPPAFIVGCAVGFWLFSIYRVPMRHRVIGGLLCGAYCMMPFTRFIPLATMAGAWIRYRESK